MDKINRRIKTHRKAKELICNFYDYNSNTLIIHYSCESFYDVNEGKTPRITSIAVRFLNSAQTISFSIHMVAESKNILLSEISMHLDDLERVMLNNFYDFVKEYSRYRWIHWNMRDINYGFEAIKHRANLMGVTPCEISNSDKYDLARLLVDKYGKNYSCHPRMKYLIEMNKISPKDWLDGEEEAKAFEKHDFVKLHQSTLAKVDVIDNILKLSAEDDLKTNAKFIDIYGISPQGIFELTKDNWFYSLLLTLLGIGITMLIK